MTSQDDSAATPESGSLAERPVPRLILDLHRAGFSGVLELSRVKTTKAFVFVNGAPATSESSQASESLVTHLREQDRLTGEQQLEVEAYVGAKGCQEAAALLSLKVVDSKTLFQSLKDLTRRRLLECFAWNDGSYELKPHDDPSADAKPFRTDPYPLVLTGVETHWSTDRILASLADRLDFHPQPADGCAKVLRRLEYGEITEQVIEGMNGARSLGEAIGTAINHSRALAVVWLLCEAQLLTMNAEPIHVSEGDGEPDLEIEVALAETREQAASGAATPATGAASRANEKSSQPRPDGSKSIRNEILEKHAELDSLTYYQLLGIDSDARGAKVKKAYFKLAKTYHPDALARQDLGDIAAEASEVFSRIAEAFDVLSDDEKRQTYDAALRGESTDVDIERLAQAESLFRKGEILANMGNFKGAIDFLEPAVELWPSEPEYHSAFGWALFKKSPPENERAHVELLRALELNPDDAVAHQRLGTVLSALGDEAGAAEHTARGRALDGSRS